MVVTAARRPVLRGPLWLTGVEHAVIWLSMAACFLLAGALGWLAHDIRDLHRDWRAVRDEIQARVDEESVDG